MDFFEFIYYSNFHSFFDSIKDYNNDYLKRFMKTKILKKKQDVNLIYWIMKNWTWNWKHSSKFKKLCDINYKILENFTNDFLLYVNKVNTGFSQHNEIQLIKYNQIDDSFIIINQIGINEEISSLNFSPYKNKIYVCLQNKKSVSIINFNYQNTNLTLSGEKIEIYSNDHF